MKKIQDLSPLAGLRHVVASFTSQISGEVYWASKCSCGSDTDENNQCLAAKAEKERVHANQK